MSTKNLFSDMLNEKPVVAPSLKVKGTKLQKSPGVKEFAYLGGGPGQSMLKHDSSDIAPNIWGKILKAKGGI